MTIKKRFLISYIGGILLAWGALLAILCIMLYVTTGSIPSPGSLYRTFTQQRSLSPEEEAAYIQLRGLAKSEPEQLLTEDSELMEQIHQFEGEGLEVAVRKQDNITYYSKELVKKSILVHFPSFDANNLETRGTTDNAGRLYRYIKFDFYFTDGDRGSILVLKKESSFLEFMSKWGLLIMLAILLVSGGGMLFLMYLLQKTTLTPLEALGKGMAGIRQGNLTQLVSEKRIEHYTQEVVQLSSDFEEMRLALLQSKEEQYKLENNRKELIASISHDLKTPITSIIGYVEGLLEGVAASPEKQQKYLETIHTKAVTLDYMIEELFLYSKLDAAVIPFHFELLHMDELLNHIVDEQQLSNPEMVVTRRLAADLVIFGDRLQLKRVFDNLISNSIKFKQQDEPLRLTITAKKLEQTIVVEITDNGRGIPDKQLPFIFEHFYRGEEARTSETGGSGLGLAIVKQIVEQHLGRVQAVSRLNRGTTVTVILNEYEEADK